MKLLIKKLLRENIQLADKLYFNQNKLSPQARELILRITNGDPYTKLITDMYYYQLFKSHKMDSSAMAGADPNYKESETPESDILAMQDMKDIKGLYNILKTYNKNIFPIKSFNINGVDDIGTFMRTLKNREKIIQTLNSLPSIAIRNMKNDIRQERDFSETKDYMQELDYFQGLFSQLGNRDVELRKNIEKKMFRSNITLEDLLDFAQEKENLLGGVEFTKQKIIEIVKEENNEYDELKIKFNKGDVMVIEVSGPNGIKKIGCNSLWCFTYGRNGAMNYNDWYNYSTNDLVYVIIDFKEPTDSPDFMHVLIKPLMVDYSVVGSDGDDVLFNMANSGEEEPNSIIQHYFDFDFAKRLMNFGVKPERTPKPKKNRTDPNQLSIDFNQPAEINEYDDEEDDYEDDEDEYYYGDEEQYFKPKLDADVKANSSRYEGRNVVWYGSIGNMIVLTRDEVDGMTGNIYDEEKLAYLTKLIRDYPEKVELECSYAHGHVINLIDIKEELESFYNDRFVVEYDGHEEPNRTGDEELDEYIGKDLDNNYWYNLDYDNDNIEPFFEKYRTSVAQGKSVDELTLEFKQLNPTENEIDTFKEFINMENKLKDAQANDEGDFNKFKVQLRDGHHRVFAAFNSGERYVCVDLVDDGIKKYKGYYNLVK